MKYFKKWPVSLALFVAGFLLLNGLVEFAGLKLRADTTVDMHDMKQAENIDIVFLGNSLVYSHVDTTIMESAFGEDCFGLGASNARSLTVYAIAEEIYQHHSPKTVVWVHDPSPVEFEPLVVETRIWPHLTSCWRKLSYALHSAAVDGAYLDRFFPWRQDIPASVKEIQANIKNKVNPEPYYEKCAALFQSTEGTITRYYNGKGYRPLDRGLDNPYFHNTLTQKVKMSKNMDLSADKDVLLALRDLCARNGSRLIVISSPTIPQVLLGDEKTVYVMDSMKQMCRENGVPYLDMARARPELLSTDLMPYFYNAWHMTKDGAEIYSRALAKALKDYMNGKDIYSYFYTPEEYANAHNYILNGWYTEKVKDGQITYAADCIYGADVDPQYQFSAVDENGRETLLKHFSREAQYTCPQKEMEGKEIRISIRNAVDLEQEIVTAIQK